MKKSIIPLVLLVIACADLESTMSYTFMQNDTAHTISVKSYYQGNLTPHLSFELLPHEKKQVMYRSGRGMGGGECYATFTSLEDYIVVIFDDMESIVHYGKLGIVDPSKKSVLYDSPRSLYNPNNFIKKTIKKTSSSVTYHFFYTFTEQDYLDAKQ